MKTGIHPELFECRVSCSGCGAEFTTFTTRSEIRVEVCSQCHPFFTGKQARIVDTEGRVEKFIRKFEGKEARVSKRKRKQAAAEIERAALAEREARLAAEKEAEEKARREEARRKRAEERAARKAAQESAEEAEAAPQAGVVFADAEAPPPAPEAGKAEAFPYTNREVLEEFIRKNTDLMKKASDEGRPAVEPLGFELKKEFGLVPKEDDVEEWNKTRQWFGRIVKREMGRIGYEVDRARGENGNERIAGNPVFSSGACYRRQEAVALKPAAPPEFVAPEPAPAEDAAPEVKAKPAGKRDAGGAYGVVYEELKKIAKAGKTTYYSDVAPLVGLDPNSKKFWDLLDEISLNEDKAGRGLLSVVVVGKDEEIPGRGFFDLARESGRMKGEDKNTFFKEELQKVHGKWR